jgi:four helix bundle protein
MKSFEDLECWRRAAALRREVSSAAKKFPAEERYRLTDQLIRASRSVTANIAEGYGRYHYQENIQFCRHAGGSLFEIIDHVIVAEEECYISKDKLSELRKMIDECLAILNGYINYLGKAKSDFGVKEPEVTYHISSPGTYSTDN